jgi:hypothetical protein
MAAKKTARKRTSKRELIDTGTDKRYVRRSAKGRFQEAMMWDDPCRRIGDAKQRRSRRAPARETKGTLQRGACSRRQSSLRPSPLRFGWSR